MIEEPREATMIVVIVLVGCFLVDRYNNIVGAFPASRPYVIAAVIAATAAIVARARSRLR